MKRKLVTASLCVAMFMGLAPAHGATAAAGDVFAFGSNQFGQAGQGTTSVNPLVATPIDVSNLGGLAITQVVAGDLHSLILAEGGTVFSFGTNSAGRTGLGTNIGNTTAATAIDTSNLGGRAITQVAVGTFHGLLLDEDGTVFSFGSNNQGQTGLGTDSGFTPVATAIDTSNLGGRAIKQVAAGGTTSLLLAEDGSVFSFGFNGNGRTGQGTTSGNTTVATAINTFWVGGRAIKQVAAGKFHNLLLAEDGTVFSFGFSSLGATGLGTTSGDTLVATPINASNLGGRTITQVSAGGNHSLLLAEDGTVFSFGFNGSGATGQGTNIDITPVARPIDTSNLGGRTIVQVSAGGGNSLLLAEDGTVFSFGVNQFGATGLGTTSDVFTTVATAIDASNLGGLAITQVSAGGSHSLLIAVPEPGTLAVAGPALLGLAVRRRKRAAISR